MDFNEEGRVAVCAVQPEENQNEVVQLSKQWPNRVLPSHLAYSEDGDLRMNIIFKKCDSYDDSAKKS